MILPTMTLAEAADAVRREAGASKQKVFDILVRFGQAVKRQPLRATFPMSRDYTFTSRYRTTFYVRCTAHRRSDWDKPLFTVWTPFHMRGGLFSALLTENGSVFVLTAHFFERYRERVLPGSTLGANDLISEFHRRNTNISLSLDYTRFSDNFSKYEKSDTRQFAARVPDGNCFGEQLGPQTFVFRTIITDAMLGDGQYVAFERLEKYREDKQREKQRYRVA